MRIVRSPDEVRQAARGRVGFVPTMGALHEGHLDLIRKAAEECDQVVVSVFVNPTQFGPNEDFARYPRQEARDVELAASAGAELVFAPRVETVYSGSQTVVRVQGVTDLWEGELRPGHFEGVATVVAKLFGMVRCHTAYFGWKDLQQCLTIRAMVRDLHLPLSLRFIETRREPDGLAMSSRNRYLSEQDRALAVGLSRSLAELKRTVLAGTEPFDGVRDREAAKLAASGFDVEYLEWVDLETMQICREPEEPSAFIVAARLGSTRLIDNLRLKDPRWSF